MLIMVHMASVWVPFTSESKEAIAHYPEIIKEMRLALQECGRLMAIFIRRRKREADEAKKRAYIEKYIPQLAIGLQQILGFSDRDRDAGRLEPDARPRAESEQLAWRHARRSRRRRPGRSRRSPPT